VIKSRRDGLGMWKIQGSEEWYTKFWMGNLRLRDNLEDTGMDGRIRLK
jgi:hypothetical protein